MSARRRSKRTRVLLAAVAMGVTLGTASLRAQEAASTSDPVTPTASASPAADVERHGCKGMNDCRGQGGCMTDANLCAGKNGCKGKGGCATVKHDCKGKNDCRGQGRYAKNECKGQGECAVPIKE